MIKNIVIAVLAIGLGVSAFFTVKNNSANKAKIAELQIKKDSLATDFDTSKYIALTSTFLYLNLSKVLDAIIDNNKVLRAQIDEAVMEKTTETLSLRYTAEQADKYKTIATGKLEKWLHE